MSIQPAQTDIIPSEPDKREVARHVAQSYACFALLSYNQKTVLSCLLDDFVSGSFRTDTQIAKDCEISRKTVYTVKRSPEFLNAVVEIMPEVAKIKLPEVIANAVKLSSKTYKAGEFVARFTGAYVPKRQQLNINANLRARSQMSPQKAIDTFLRKLLSLGWSPDRIYERAKELQANQP